MTDATSAAEGAPAFPAGEGRVDRPPRQLWRILGLWAAFVAVHLVVGLLALYGPGLPLGDVNFVYSFWVQYGFTHGIWVGIDTVWVYPVMALLPMLAANLFGPDFYASTWLSLVMLVNAGAFAVIVRSGRDPARRRIGWWWLAFLALLGPIAVGRIDSVTVPIAIVGVLMLFSRPRLAGVLLTIAAWIKVWPAAIVVAAIVALPRRTAVFAAAVASSVLVASVAIAFGGGANLLSFVSQQAGRGLQVEAPISAIWMWGARSGTGSVYYDTDILTYQVTGPGSDVAAAVMTPLLALVAALILLLGLHLIRRGIPAEHVLPPLVLALTTSLIVFNKVGSPQFVTWLAVPLVLGLATTAPRVQSFRMPAVLILTIAALTQAIYPYLYWQVISLNAIMLVVLTARNLLYVLLLVWAVRSLVRLAARDREFQGSASVVTFVTTNGIR
ncbi:MAG TPA: glycosyltransferase 87 family protein [Pseudolysinimonas sp.]|nr:glycosyltransferase 87 family protein [Pseudolysinimonas sp.]